MLILFDIDGTLLHCHGAGLRSMVAAGSRICEREFDPEGIVLAGALDSHLWRELCANNGVEEAAEREATFRVAYATELEQHIEREGRVRAIDGAHELVGALRARSGVALGILSGNYPETGRLKIAAAGFDPDHFPVGAWGDDGDHRRDLVGVALERARVLGCPRAPEQVVVVGDTPRDVDCARATGCRSLAVSTGVYAYEELLPHGADLTVRDLGDTDAVSRWILSA